MDITINGIPLHIDKWETGKFILIDNLSEIGPVSLDNIDRPDIMRHILAEDYLSLVVADIDVYITILDYLLATLPGLLPFYKSVATSLPIKSIRTMNILKCHLTAILRHTYPSSVCIQVKFNPRIYQLVIRGPLEDQIGNVMLDVTLLGAQIADYLIKYECMRLDYQLWGLSRSDGSRAPIKLFCTELMGDGCVTLSNNEYDLTSYVHAHLDKSLGLSD
jgi:hypothetical protein